MRAFMRVCGAVNKSRSKRHERGRYICPTTSLIKVEIYYQNATAFFRDSSDASSSSVIDVFCQQRDLVLTSWPGRTERVTGPAAPITWCIWIRWGRRRCVTSPSHVTLHVIAVARRLESADGRNDSAQMSSCVYSAAAVASVHSATISA